MHFPLSRHVQGNGHALRGLSLVELVVVTAIILTISALVLVSHSQFSANVVLSNLAYDVALSIRQAQVFGIGAREATISGSDFDTGYGIHFDSGSLTTYILFADLDRDGLYDGVSELVQSFTLQQGYSISALCGVQRGGGEQCGPGAIDFLDIVFDRPEPDALIRSNRGSYVSARITIRSPQGGERSVTAAETGQISVDQSGGVPPAAPPAGPPPPGPSSNPVWQLVGGGQSGCNLVSQGPRQPDVTAGEACSPVGAQGYVNERGGGSCRSLQWFWQEARCEL